MNAIEATTETAPDAARDSQATEERAPEHAPQEKQEEQTRADAQTVDATSTEAAPPGDESEASGLRPDRRKLEEQLEALKRKEFELRRALTMADHPELADVIRVLEGRIYAITRAEAKLAQGLSKSEARRRETLDKKLTSLREKRAELDAQITALDTELHALGADRTQVFEAERRDALEQLLVALSTHDAAFREAGLEATSLVPELTRWLPEVEALAETLVANKSSQ